MEGIGGLHGWQWIFCLEGLLTIVIAIMGFFLVHDYPETATFLTETERGIITAVLAHDKQGLSSEVNSKFIWQAVMDYKTYVQMAIYIGIVTAMYAMALFIPTIIFELGYSAANAQLLTVPVFVAGCISTVSAGYLSDKFNKRGPFIIGCSLISLIGFAVLYAQKGPRVGYAGAVIAAVGAYPTIPVTVAWAASGAGGDLKKGVVLAMVIATGNLGGICSSFAYTNKSSFHNGHGIIMSCLCWSIFWSIFAMWNYHRLNKEKVAYCKEEDIDETKNAEFEEMGNESPLFRYTL